MEIAQSVKTLKIVTKDMNKASYLEYTLYTKYGIAIQITNNKNKALNSSNLIINYDLNEEELKRYKMPDDGVLVNIKYKTNNFESNLHILNDYVTEYDEEILEDFKFSEDFDKNVLYESFIYRRDNYSNIKKLLKRDRVKLLRLY